MKDKSKVLPDKRVVSIDQTADGVVVKCKDGSSYTGDIVAGADGIHSTVRYEMWRHAETHGDGALIAKDRKGEFLMESSSDVEQSEGSIY